MFFTSYSITPHIAKNKEPSDSKLTHTHTPAQGQRERVWEREKQPFYLILSAIHEYVLFRLLSYFSLMDILDHFLCMFLHNEIVRTSIRNYMHRDRGVFESAQIQIKLIANCWHFFVRSFVLFSSFFCCALCLALFCSVSLWYYSIVWPASVGWYGIKNTHTMYGFKLPSIPEIYFRQRFRQTQLCVQCVFMYLDTLAIVELF